MRSAGDDKFEYLKMFLAEIQSLSPDSMEVERAVSAYNDIKTLKRESLHLTSLNERLMISRNGPAVVDFDPRPAVVQFMTAKDRRNKAQAGVDCGGLYSEREFVKRFFKD